MKIALDPFRHCHLSLEELPDKVAALGYAEDRTDESAKFMSAEMHRYVDKHFK